MLARPLLNRILGNDALTRGLGDAEARVLVEWLVEQAEWIAGEEKSSEQAWTLVNKLCRRMRAIGRFVGLWCHEGARGAAVQLAATERFNWPLPTRAVDPCDLMLGILMWEGEQMRCQPLTAWR